VRTAVLAAALAVAAAASADVGDVRWKLVLHGRYSDRENDPERTVRFDPALRAFDAASYLRPSVADAYPSTFLSAAADGREGWLRWGLAADSGELRSEAVPATAQVCFSTANASGLAPRAGRCDVRVDGALRTFALDSTHAGPERLTSNGQPFRRELDSTWLLREAWLGAALGRNDFALVRAGRKRFTVADGFVYDDWGTGAEATFDLGALGPSWDVGAALFYPTRAFPHGSGWGSLMFAARADYLPSLFEHAGLFAAYFRDRSRAMVELFRGALAEASAVRLRAAGAQPGSAAFADESRLLALELDAPLQGDADVGWAGTSGSLALGRARLEWTAALVVGQLTVPDVTLTTLTADAVRARTRYRSRGIFGQLAHARLRVPAGGGVRLGGFFLFLSGDQPPSERASGGSLASYGGFLGVAPFVTDTNIFFNGGVGESFASRQATAPGVNARGVVAPGLSAGWDPSASLGVEARAAYLVAPAAGPFGGRVYGPEVDLELTWAPLRWLTLVAEGDALFPGDFWPGRATVTRVVLGFDVVAF
jgi:hypothetical protein